MASKLTLIIPTLGRSTLSRAVRSATRYMGPDDQVIVVGDGPLGIGDQVAEDGGLYVEIPVRVGDYGCTPCDLAMNIASGDYVFFLGDDDLCVGDAFDIIREAVEEKPGVPHLFSMLHTGVRLGGTLECSRVSGQQIVVPRDMTRMPKMADCPPNALGVSDWVFIVKVCKEWGKVVFHDDIIAILPVMNQGKML